MNKLLPPKLADLDMLTVDSSKDLFYKFRRDTDRQRMAADVDIKVSSILTLRTIQLTCIATPNKLRGFYYDRIERTEVTALLDSIYAHVQSLEDIQFLVKYARQVLPPKPEDANGKVVWGNILTLQAELTQQREVPLVSASLCDTLSLMYDLRRPL